MNKKDYEAICMKKIKKNSEILLEKKKDIIKDDDAFQNSLKYIFQYDILRKLNDILRRLKQQIKNRSITKKNRK